MRVALPNGELVKSGGKVVKNVVGYDLNKMHVGGLGTLGVIVEVTLKVHPLPAAEATVWASFARLDAAHAVAGQLFRSVLYPRAVELVRASLEPVSGGSGWQVLMWASGATATVERQVQDALIWCREGGATDAQRLDGEAHASLWRRVAEFGRSEGAVLVKLTCLPSAVAELVTAVERQANPLPSIVAHAGSGITYVALPEQMDADVVQRIVEEATRLGGSGVVERAPIELKRHLDVWGPTRGDFPLMQALKAQFDPQSVLNPGRFLGGI
jgi:glycolate oxidase FAD binding subunit